MAEPRAGSDFPAVGSAVARAIARIGRTRDPLARATAYGALLAYLQQQIEAATAERDAALTEVLAEPEHPSHRALARQLQLSRQRVDQLAQFAAKGGRRRR